MRRIVDWTLSGLAIAAALRALRYSPRKEAGATALTPADPLSVTAQRGRWRSLWAFAVELRDEFRSDHITMIAGSLAYYAMLAMFPAAIAAISIYGLVLDADSLAGQLERLAEVLPESTAALISTQLTEIVTGSTAGLGFGATVSLLATLWTSSGGTRALLLGINIAYDVDEYRPYVYERILSYALTIGLIVFVAASVALVTFLPSALEALGLDRDIRRLIEYARWPSIFVVVVAGLGLLYRHAPHQVAHRSPWLNRGALLASGLWVAATVGFSLYASTLGSFNATYGALTGFIVLLLWFFISGIVILLGAEVNAIVESRKSDGSQRMISGPRNVRIVG